MKILKIISTVSLIGIFGTASANSSNDTQLKAEPSIGIKSITLHLKNLQNSSQADFEIFGIKNGEHKLIDRESVAPMDDELVTFLEAKIGKYDKLLVKETNVSDQLYKLDQLNNNVELTIDPTEKAGQSRYWSSISLDNSGFMICGYQDSVKCKVKS